MNALLDGLAYARDALRDDDLAELNDWLRQQPSSSSGHGGRPVMQHFQLVQHDHASAVVAEGEEFDNGLVALHWVGGQAVETLPGVEAVRQQHCADGRTAIRWRTPFTDNGWSGP